MHFPTTLLSLLTLFTTTITATGTANVLNLCPNTLYLWSVASNVSDQFTLGPGTTYTEAIHTDPVSGGIAIKITETENGLGIGAPQLIFAYTLNPAENSVYYDLNTVFGNPIGGRQHKIETGASGCPSLELANGTRAEGSAKTVACFQDTDLTLRLCSS